MFVAHYFLITTK